MCTQCQVIRDYYPTDPWHHKLHNPACIYCGARLIQIRQRSSHLSRGEKVTACRRALSLWMQYGHSEAELRTLVKGAWAVAPAKELANEAPQDKPSSKGRGKKSNGRAPG